MCGGKGDIGEVVLRSVERIQGQENVEEEVDLEKYQGELKVGGVVLEEVPPTERRDGQYSRRVIDMASNSLRLQGVAENPGDQEGSSIPNQPLHILITEGSGILAPHNLAELGMAPLPWGARALGGRRCRRSSFGSGGSRLCSHLSCVE